MMAESEGFSPRPLCQTLGNPSKLPKSRRLQSASKLSIGSLYSFKICLVPTKNRHQIDTMGGYLSKNANGLQAVALQAAGFAGLLPRIGRQSPRPPRPSKLGMPRLFPGRHRRAARSQEKPASEREANQQEGIKRSRNLISASPVP